VQLRTKIQCPVYVIDTAASEILLDSLNQNISSSRETYIEKQS